MEMLVVKSKIRDFAQDCNVSGDVADALNEMAYSQLKMAAKRAEANGRKTVQARDLIIVEGTAPTDSLVVKSKIRDAVAGYNVGGDLADALNYSLVWTIKQGAKRAESNGRKTLQARDL